ncbi:MAG TPA: activator of (R)-2-hydroxyglutaryl-CoA dehydratase [Terriglobia bacterium]|nr:activator of (R)-2-hydroxyglutaryl-CoA dehydratase [Terriglobia bacterium]
MSTAPFNGLHEGVPLAGPANGLVQIGSQEELVRQRLDEERRRLEQEAGLERRSKQQFHRPVERAFTKAERDKTTILFGGLTWKHEKLVHGALESLGYNCEAVPVANKRAFQLGKEYGNNGQCNPTYFTVGNLVQFLQNLEEMGLTKQEIINRYVFFTAGACGPCRFGMYEAEYRLALRNSGFDGFRVLLFQQSGGLNQAEAEAGLEMNLDFFLGILNALNIGDVVNDVAYQIRPFEVNPGDTDRVLDECMDLLQEVMRRKRPYSLEGKFGDWLSKTSFSGTATMIGKFMDQLYGDDYTAALVEVRERFNAIPIDRTRVKPVVKITGEFWAQTTEGDGNFNMFKFLEKEGAQVMVEPVGTWIMYMIHQAKQKIRDQRGIDLVAESVSRWNFTRIFGSHFDTQQKIAKLTFAETIFKREYHKLIDALGGVAHHLTDQYELQRIGHPFYNSRAGGGEGHLEVAKNIYYSNKDLCHMVLSLKPFGCMPSTQSDGAQSAVVSQYKDMIFLPVETSGEGDVNAHSRVQMALGEAKVRAKNEMKAVLEKTGYTLEEVQEFVAEHPEMQQPMYKYGHHKGVIGVAANFAMHAAERMKAEKRELVAVN